MIPERSYESKFISYKIFPVRFSSVLLQWKKWTYKQYYDEANTTAKGFIKLGLEPRKTVAILGFNAPEWFISEMGAIFAG